MQPCAATSDPTGDEELHGFERCDVETSVAEESGVDRWRKEGHCGEGAVEEKLNGFASEETDYGDEARRRTTADEETDYGCCCGGVRWRALILAFVLIAGLRFVFYRALPVFGLVRRARGHIFGAMISKALCV